MAARPGILTRIASLFGMSTRSATYDAASLAWPRWRDDRGWNAGGTVPASVIALSEQKYRNDGYFKNAVEARVTGLVGAGWGFVPANADLLDDWNAFAARGVWGGGSIDGLTIALVRAKEISGEGIAVLQPDGTWHPLPRTALPSDYSADLSDGRMIRENIEYVDGREVAVHFRLKDGVPLERIERGRYIRLYRQDFPGQVRGVPSGVSVLTATDTLADTENALVTGIKVAAMFAGIATDENNAGAAFPFDGTPSGSGNVLESGLEPGTLKILPAGWRVQFATPQQAQQSAEFLRHQLHRIASGFGVPTHLVSNNLSDANYSSLRAGMVEFNARLEAEQFATLVPQMLRPIWEAFALRQYLAGKADNLDAAMSCEFIAPARPWVDPAKDAAATAQMLKLGLTSRRRAAAELGWDVSRLDDEIAADRRREQSLGIDLSEKADG